MVSQHSFLEWRDFLAILPRLFSLPIQISPLLLSIANIYLSCYNNSFFLLLVVVIVCYLKYGEHFLLIPNSFSPDLSIPMSLWSLSNCCWLSRAKEGRAVPFYDTPQGTSYWFFSQAEIAFGMQTNFFSPASKGVRGISKRREQPKISWISPPPNGSFDL